jgi:hypothetical protein
MSQRRDGSGHLVNERADRLADLGVVSHEPMPTAFDAHELGCRDAFRGLGGEPIWRQVSSLALMTSVGTVSCSRGIPLQ